ncbi:VOC family protein [Cytophagaceae bacterium YF14B1]|uniref:VOC family protein n=1 Tax=Xanthocytophaga flava TaxID=3048013 RepID=A0AAE3QR84_9BACT|nr:VOC family protein [Xanthocytophaga flavus]MDJ1481948.1 VOC family protein [Xanthocytophaga flavus]
MEETNITIQHPLKNEASEFSTMRGGHVALRAADYAGIVKWYQEKLDFRIIQEWPLGDLQLAFLAPPNDDNFCVEILGGGQPFPQPDYTDLNESLQPAGYHHFCLEVLNIDQTVAELRRRGVNVLGEPFDFPTISKRMAFFADPYGNLIELASRLK